MSCTIRCRYTVRICVQLTANFPSLAALHVSGLLPMLPSTARSVSVLISRKVQLVISASSRAGFTGSSPDHWKKLATKVNNQSSAAALIIQDYLNPIDTAGVNLHLRRKRLADAEQFPEELTLLLMHGDTFSSGSLFDAPLGSASFMDQLALSGFDVYAVDVRGYGASTWPTEIAEAADPTTFPVRIETAVRDLSAAIDHILERSRLDQLNLVAMSWGGSVAGAYTAKNNGKIKRLALIAPLWLRQSPGRIDAGGKLPPYREVDLSKYQEICLTAAPDNQRDALIPPGWFDVWAETTLALVPPATHPTPLSPPSGAVQDIREYWASNRPYYDP